MSLTKKNNNLLKLIINCFDSIEAKSDEQKSELRINDTINSLVLSLNGLSPKVYGIFSCGQIQQYFKVSYNLN